MKCIKQGIKPVSGAVGEIEANNTISPAPAPTAEVSPLPYDIPAAPSNAPMVMPPPLPMPGYEVPPAAPYVPPTAPYVPPAAPYVAPAAPYVPPAAPYVAPVPVAPPAPISFNHTAAPRSRDDPRCKDCVEYCNFAVAALKVSSMNS